MPGANCAIFGASGVTSSVTAAPARWTATFTERPAGVSSTSRSSCRALRTRSPSNDVTTSPVLRPAFWAAPSLPTSVTMAPADAGQLLLGHVGGFDVADDHADPRAAHPEDVEAGTVLGAANLPDDDAPAVLVLAVGILPAPDDDAVRTVPVLLDDHAAFLAGRRCGGGVEPARADQGRHRRQRRHSRESHTFLHNEERARFAGSEQSDAGAAQPAGPRPPGALPAWPTRSPRPPTPVAPNARRRSSSWPSARTSSSCACSSPTSWASSRTSRSRTASSPRRWTARSCSTAPRSRASSGSRNRTCSCGRT